MKQISKNGQKEGKGEHGISNGLKQSLVDLNIQWKNYSTFLKRQLVHCGCNVGIITFLFNVIVMMHLSIELNSVLNYKFNSVDKF
ncbi:MAG TPA: hypothetical protein DEB37_13390 [Lysinibacillus sp.]|nr:hypothetical protein [Lysinibacillus sp.]